VLETAGPDCHTGVAPAKGSEVKETMRAAALDHPGPWTEEEFLALPDRGQRHELLDGSLLVTPAPSSEHQQVARRLANALEAAAPDGLEVVEAVNVRVGPSRILIPDVVVTRHLGDTLVYDAAEVVLVAEVVSPSTVATDRLLKPELYAAAGIGWCLRVELPLGEPPELIAYRRSGGRYVEHGRAQPGRALRLPGPIALRLDLAALLRRGPR
jgi:Uma2 family endonuclease